MDSGQKFYHPLENIEETEDFYAAIQREHLTKSLSRERPYTYWTMELYDQKNGIRGGGGLGVLAADTRRIAEEMQVPLTLITPFYPYETRQTVELSDEHLPVKYQDFGFSRIDTVHIKCDGNLVALEVLEKKFDHTRIVAVTEPNFGELYSGLSGSDHRLYQEVALGFGGYLALKLLGLKPAVMQLNEVATFFAALARLDELASSGMDFYEAMVYTRKHTLYTNHTLVQAAEAEFSVSQFERFVLPNLRSLAVKKWLLDKFDHGQLKLSSVAIEIAEMRSGVSKLHARVADYRDVAGNRVKFKAITNGIDLSTWALPEILEFYKSAGILDKFGLPSVDYVTQLEKLDFSKIVEFKAQGREVLNSVLQDFPDQNGRILRFGAEDFLFCFKRRLVDYKRPELPFENPGRLREILEKNGAHYILAGRVHTGDTVMLEKLQQILATVVADDYLREHVHYLPNYNEKLAYALSAGCNAAVNVPVVGLEACGTSWMKDVANLSLLISTHDGGVADAGAENYLNVKGASREEELDSLYGRMSEALEIAESEFDLEYTLRRQLAAYLPVISGARMLKDYLNYLFPEK